MSIFAFRIKKRKNVLGMRMQTMMTIVMCAGFNLGFCVISNHIQSWVSSEIDEDS